MKTIRRKLDELSGIDLGSDDQKVLKGGAAGYFIIDCTCKNGGENLMDIWWVSTENVIDTYYAQYMCEEATNGMGDSFACTIEGVE